MVWFQCDDCGENLKKPKLQNHFRRCSATKLSCIDCGIVFSQQSVQGHTQCVSETEKYGPKGAISKKENMQTPKKQNNSVGVDLTLGLSTKPPWSCSLCNVKATSQETLMLHSEGKKHRSKARSSSSKNSNSDHLSSTAILTQAPIQSSVSLNRSGAAVLSGIESVKEQQDSAQPEDESLGKNEMMVDGSNIETEAGKESNSIGSEKKRRKSTSSTKENKNKRVKGSSNMENGSNGIIERGQTDGKIFVSEEVVNGNSGLCDTNRNSACLTKLKTIKWKKLIKRTLQNAPDSKMKLKKFRKTVIALAAEKLGESVDEALLTELDNQEVLLLENVYSSVNGQSHSYSALRFNPSPNLSRMGIRYGSKARAVASNDSIIAAQGTFIYSHVIYSLWACSTFNFGHGIGQRMQNLLRV